MASLIGERLTLVEQLQLVCIEMATMTATFRHEHHATIVRVWSQYRAAALASLMPSQQSSTGLGGDLRDKPRLVSTPEEIAAWCHQLSRRMGINRDFPEGEFYLAPPSPADFQRLTLPDSTKLKQASA